MTSQIWTAARELVTSGTITAKAAIAAQAKFMRKVIFPAPRSISGPYVPRRSRITQRQVSF